MRQKCKERDRALSLRHKSIHTSLPCLVLAAFYLFVCGRGSSILGHPQRYSGATPGSVIGVEAAGGTPGSAQETYMVLGLNPGWATHKASALTPFYLSILLASSSNGISSLLLPIMSINSLDRTF